MKTDNATQHLPTTELISIKELVANLAVTGRKFRFYVIILLQISGFLIVAIWTALARFGIVKRLNSQLASILIAIPPMGYLLVSIISELRQLSKFAGVQAGYLDEMIAREKDLIERLSNVNCRCLWMTKERVEIQIQMLEKRAATLQVVAIAIPIIALLGKDAITAGSLWYYVLMLVLGSALGAFFLHMSLEPLRRIAYILEKAAKAERFYSVSR